MSTDAKSIVIRQRFSVPVAQLFTAWVDLDTAKLWLAPGTMKVTSAHIDPVPNGNYCIEMKEHGGETVVMKGKVLEIEENRFLKIAWEWQHVGVTTPLELTFNQVGSSESELVLNHSGFSSMDETQNHQNGWKRCLEKLEKVF